MAKKTNKNLVKVSMNLPKRIVDKAKEFSDITGINITSAYILLLNEGIKNTDLISSTTYYNKETNTIETKDYDEFD